MLYKYILTFYPHSSKIEMQFCNFASRVSNLMYPLCNK